jgi:hypothetical protein
MKFLPLPTLPRNRSGLVAVTLASDSDDDHDSLWCLASSWEDMISFMKLPEKFLRKRMGIRGESKYSVLFTYSGFNRRSKVQCLLQGVETKPTATAMCKPLDWETVLANRGSESGETAGKVVSRQASCLGAFENSVQITFRPDLKVAYSHLKVDPQNTDIATAFTLMALNPARMIDELLARKDLARKYRESRASTYLSDASPSWIDDNGGRIRYTKSAPSSISFMWEGPPKRGCYFCAQCVGSYKVKKGTDGQNRYEITNTLVMIAEYCPPSDDKGVIPILTD